MIKGYKAKYLLRDIPAGIITALVSIPISMGYAQVAGLPAVYGLYGSLVPILLFGVLTTSPRFVFGVDAAPTVLVGGLLTTLGIVSGSSQAIEVVPVITLVTAGWLLFFYIIGAGKFVKYISSPVLGGFISGIGCTIILMQIPKLYGGEAGNGEVLELVRNIWTSVMQSFHLLSFLLGIGTVIIIYACRIWIPKVPVSIVIMLISAWVTRVFHIDQYGIALLPHVDPGLPKLVVPHFEILLERPQDIFIASASIAIVIVAETLLFTNSYAQKYDDKINNQREIIAYAASNVVSALIGATPVSGSVSRTSLACQFGVKSQVMSLVASITMGLMLLFGTGFIGYLPVPVLTGIVIAALIGTLEFGLARKLRTADRTEWMVFCVVFIVVLLFGTIGGVLTGVMLSFIIVIIRASTPPRTWLGCIVDRDGFYPLDRARNASPICHTIIYRFTGALFFANIGQFQDDIEQAIREDTYQVIVDASGIGSIDVTAAQGLLTLYKKMKKRNIKFYITEHAGQINDQLRTFDAEELLQNGVVKHTIGQALEDAKVYRPYTLETIVEEKSEVGAKCVAEFEWAFGKEADKKMEKMASVLAGVIASEQNVSVETISEIERMAAKGYWDMEDEDAFLDILEMRMVSLKNKKKHIWQKYSKKNKSMKNLDEQIERLNEQIINRHIVLESKLTEKNMEAMKRIRRRRLRREQMLKERNPEAYKQFRIEREKYKKILEEKNPELAQKLKDMREQMNK